MRHLISFVIVLKAKSTPLTVKPCAAILLTTIFKQKEEVFYDRSGNETGRS